MRIKRHRVVLRKKVKTRRLARLSIVGIFLILGTWAVITLQHLSKDLPTQEELAGLFIPGNMEIRGLPEPLAVQVQASLKSASGGLVDRLEAVKKEYPMIRNVDAYRRWFKNTIRLTFDLHTAVAVKAGTRTTFLSTTGTLFSASKELYPGELPSVRLSGARESDVRKLAHFLTMVRHPGSFLSPLRSMTFVSKHEGWKAEFEDKTRVLWGDLRWTSQKLMRLKQVIDDAKTADSRTMIADMRYFEDGKILVRRMP